jgi:hypothetical protein
MIGSAVDILLVVNNKNFDYTNLIKNSYIRSAELKHVKPILGADFYKLVDTTPSSYATLINSYLKELIAFYTLYESLPFLNVQVTDKGIMINDSETANQGSSAQRAELRMAVLSMAEALKNDTIEYMKENESDYENEKPRTKIIGGIIL